ncbi:hypothetical protein GCM10027051_05110 [Niabella terrae]
MLDKLINFFKGLSEPSAGPQRIPFGRYSDNNKTVAKANRWNEADDLFKEKKYLESVHAFFDYLRDDQMENVRLEGDQQSFDFELQQGSKVVRGRLQDGQISAEVRLARMPQASVPVMRRLLEMNFGLYYSRYAISEDALCMRFDTDLETANPSKLYYGLKELAIKSDKQDDLLVQDFSVLEPIGNEHIHEMPETEKQVKYNYMQRWIRETLDKINSVDPDKFSGGISYLLLSLVYRIDFLLAPEGRLLNELEKISGIYFKKDEAPMIEKNRDMAVAFEKLLAQPQDFVFENLFRSKYTFSIVTPQPYKVIADLIKEAGENMLWYRDNQHEDFALKIIEYGLTHCQYTYSLPRAISQLVELFMEINYPDFFRDLGYEKSLYHPEKNTFQTAEIISRIRQVQQEWRAKHPLMNFATDQLDFSSLMAFNQRFTAQLALLNMNNK